MTIVVCGDCGRRISGECVACGVQSAGRALTDSIGSIAHGTQRLLDALQTVQRLLPQSDSKPKRLTRKKKP